MTYEEIRLKGLFRNLREALEMLAAPASTQIAWLREIKTYPLADELALDLDDEIGVLAQIAEAGYLTQDHVNRIHTLHRKLGAMSGQVNAHLWTPDALLEHADWQEVRRLAADALRNMQPAPARGEPPQT